MRARTILIAFSLGLLASCSAVACLATDGAEGIGDSGAGASGGGSNEGGAGVGAGHTATPTPSGTTTYPGTTYTSTGTTTQGNPDEPPIEGPPDAGADADAAPFTCEGLDTSKPVILYLSADDSNSMGSPVQAREALTKGWQTPWIRTYEFLNYYRIAYPAPPPSELGLFAEAEVGASAAEIDLQLGIRSFDAYVPRRAMTITFVLDTSGSMQGTPMERQVAAVKAIAASLAEGDIVSLVTWNTSNQVMLDGHAVSGPNDPLLIQKANELTAGGGTDLHGGLVKGYEIAQANYGQARLNRVILISDGGANVGITDEDLIGNNSQDADQEGIYMVGVGVGHGSGIYDDILMDTVTDRGRGAYVYLDSTEEATRMFVDRFDETMEIAARGVQVELTLPWYFQIEKFSGEELSENPEEIEPQHLAPSDAMVFNQVLRACDPAMINSADPVKMKVTWQTPLTYQTQETSLETTVGDLLAADKPHLAKGKAIVAYAEALKTGLEADLHAAFASVEAANVSGTDPELLEIAELIQKHSAF